MTLKYEKVEKVSILLLFLVPPIASPLVEHTVFSPLTVPTTQAQTFERVY